MTKKKPPETEPEQSKRFRERVRELEAAGELSPTEADEAFERLVERALPERKRRT